MLDLQPGFVVDRYRLVEKLGEGGMAVVYRVEHATLGTPHALKVLSMGGRQVKDRLVQEGRVQATLQHPHIVAVTDVLDIDGSPGLVMEYIDGPALDEWLRKYRPTIEEALIVFRAILSGIDQAHQRGLIHRDLKPGNVMLQVTDRGVVPKVTDFGLAKIVSDQGGASLKRTRTGMAMGTPAYMAPEQIHDASSVDRRADLYSLGCILYELLTGNTPFQGNNLLELFAAIAAGSYTPIRECVPEIPASVEQVIEGLIVGDPHSRIPDCATIVDILDRGASLPDRTEDPLGPPRPLTDPGRTVLPLATPAADVARAMTRGVSGPTTISQASWEPTLSNPSTSAPPTLVDQAPSMPTMDASSSSVITPKKAFSAAFLLGLGLVFFGLVTASTVGLALFVIGEESPALPEQPVEAPVAPEVGDDGRSAGTNSKAEEETTDEPSVDDAHPPSERPGSIGGTSRREAPSVDKPKPAPIPSGRSNGAVRSTNEVKETKAVTTTTPASVPDQDRGLGETNANGSGVPSPAEKPSTERGSASPVVTGPPAATDLPPEPAPAMGTFSFTGDARVVVLKDRRSGETYKPGEPIPPGTYLAIVDGQNGGSTVVIREGRNTAIKCNTVLSMCTR